MGSFAMRKPIRILKAYMWGVMVAIVAVHTTGFGVLLSYVKRHEPLLMYGDLAGISLTVSGAPGAQGRAYHGVTRWIGECQVGKSHNRLGGPMVCSPAGPERALGSVYRRFPGS